MSNGQAVVEFDGLVLAHNERTVAEITHVAIGDPKEIWQWCDRVQARLPDGHALSSWACDNDSELGLSFREASHDAGWPALANVRSKALLLALTAFE